jgi:phenylalanyl-tRNA synthetase beta chain
MRILNPLGEDTSIMRTTTLPSMLEILARNYNFRNKSAKLYELGRTYFAKNDGSGMADEPKVLSLGAYGADMDFFALKGAVEAVLAGLRIPSVRFAAEKENPSYHPAAARRFTAAARCWACWADPPPCGRQLWRGLPALRAELAFGALYRSMGPLPAISLCPSSLRWPGISRWSAQGLPVGELADCIRRGPRAC